MNSNTTLSSEYAKKAFYIFGIIDFIITAGFLLYGGFVFGDAICSLFLPFIIFVPSLFIFTYNARIGASKIQKNIHMAQIRYYWQVIPLSILSIVLSICMGIFMALIFENLASCLMFGIFFGVYLLICWILPIWFIFLCIISIVELYVIKRKIIKKHLT